MRLFSIPLFLLLVAPLSLGLLSDNSQPELVSNNGLKTNQVSVFRTLPFEVKPGGVLKVEGSGFSKTFNKVNFTKGVSVNTVSQDGASLLIIVPKNLSEGEYKLSVSNSFGVSDADKLPVTVKITSNPTPAPVIDNASFSNGVVVLTGKGFTSKNYISTTLGELNAPIAPSTSGGLSFDVTNLSLYSKTKESFLGRSYPMTLWIFVRNEHGVSEKAYPLDINL
jgi:hypothetical protein